MKVRVLYFASLREAAGYASEEIELPRHVGTVAALRAHLACRGGNWSAFDPEFAVRAAVNQDMAQPLQTLSEGDEIAFFPPVTGG